MPLLPPLSAALADVPCIRNPDSPGAACLSAEEYQTFRTTLAEHYQQADWAKIYRMLRPMDLEGDIDLLQSRAWLYFWQNGTTIKACEAVHDLEKVVLKFPVSTGGLLDLIYHGAWKQIAAREGSPAARILLVEKLRNTKALGFDTPFKFSKRLYYGELLSLLHEDGLATAPDDLRIKAVRLREEVEVELTESGIDITDLVIAEIPPIRIVWRDNVLEIVDNGEGFEDKDMSRLTEPFYTTRRDSGGTGLGLSVVNAILERYGTQIEAAPSPDGALFRIAFPFDNDGELEGWVAKRWNNAVQDRFAALLKALGDEFDGEIEGLNLQETAIGISSETDPSFSSSVYASSLKTNMRALKSAFKTSTVMLYANFMPGEWRPWEDQGYLSGLYEFGEETGVGLGAPDLIYTRKGQLNHALALMHERSYSTPLGIAVQDGNYIGETNTLQVLHERKNMVPVLHAFARDFLKVDYMFWRNQKPYFEEDLLPCL
eukprot:g2113.t1